jgi:RNase P/RNase MRP subunit p29
MRPRRISGVALGLLLALTLSAAVSTFAQAPPRGLAGKITELGMNSLVVKTSSSSVTVKLTSSTIYSRMTRAALSNVTKGTFVTLTLASGGKTVSTISVGSRFGGFRRPTGARPVRTPGTGRRFGRPGGTFSGGQVVSVGNGHLTIRSFNGTSRTYTLAKNVTVTKSVRVTRSALHLGETVRVARAPGSTTAFAITIEAG